MYPVGNIWLIVYQTCWNYATKAKGGRWEKEGCRDCEGEKVMRMFNMDDNILHLYIIIVLKRIKWEAEYWRSMTIDTHLYRNYNVIKLDDYFSTWFRTLFRFVLEFLPTVKCNTLLNMIRSHSGTLPFNIDLSSLPTNTTNHLITPLAD